jgi:PhnB protein
MAETVRPIPQGFHTITPYLAVQGAGKLLDFLKRTFDAEVVERLERPDGAVGHAEVRIGDSMLMIGEPSDPAQAMPTMLYVYVTDADATYQRALAGGAVSLQAPADQFYGDRNAGVQDPFGNRWWLATHKEDVSPEEMKRRAAAQMKK